jgi:hypothetical protein
MKTSHSTNTSFIKKLHSRYTPIVFAFYMAAIMALLMCCTIVAFQRGFIAGYWSSVMKSYLLAMPVAFCCVIIVRPFVMRLVSMTVDIPRQGN